MIWIKQKGKHTSSIFRWCQRNQGMIISNGQFERPSVISGPWMKLIKVINPGSWSEWMNPRSLRWTLLNTPTKCKWARLVMANAVDCMHFPRLVIEDQAAWISHPTNCRSRRTWFSGHYLGGDLGWFIRQIWIYPCSSTKYEVRLSSPWQLSNLAL